MHSHNYSPAYIQAIHTHTVDYTVLMNRIFVWRNGHMDSRLKGTQVIFHEADSLDCLFLYWRRKILERYSLFIYQHFDMPSGIVGYSSSWIHSLSFAKGTKNRMLIRKWKAHIFDHLWLYVFSQWSLCISLSLFQF